MQTILKVLGALAAAVAVALLALVAVGGLSLLAPLVGALAGLVVGYVFDETSRLFLTTIGLGALQMWQFGAMAAFTGMFFKARNFSTKG